MEKARKARKARKDANENKMPRRTLRYWGFLLVCAIAAVLLLTGAVLKFTVLGDQRVTLMYSYDVTYTIEVRDVDERTADMFTKGMGLYLDETTVAGEVERIEAAAAASGQAGLQDLTLYVEATAASLSSAAPEGTVFSDPEEREFQSRFLSFRGRITSMEVEADD